VIWLLRHGETDYNREPARVQGQTDIPLNDNGRRQAHDVAERIDSCAALWSSGLIRALETARIVGGRIGREPQVDRRLAESARGGWEGRGWAEIAREEPEGFAAWRAAGDGFRFPEGESLAEQQERVVAALEEIATGPEPAVVVCHGGSIRVALCHYSGRGLGAFHDWDVPNGALIALP
jgi:probable phosphoglycerate mutase